MFPPYKYIITRILRNVNKNIRKIRKKNNRDFHTTKLNLPTGNLDSREAQEVIGLLKMTCREFNQTVVLVTHEKEIADMADQVIFLKDGKIADMERRQKNYVR